MRKSGLLAVVFLLSFALNAQPTFHHLYRSATSYTFDLNELPSGNIFTCMAATHLMNPEGYIEYSSYYHSGGTYATQTLKAASANSFYFTTGTSAAPCPWAGGDLSLVHPVIGKMDTLGSTQTLRKYELNSGVCYGPPGGLEVIGESGALFWGRDQNFFAVRVDSTLEPVWSMQVMHQGGFQFIKQLPNGDFIAGINMDTAGVVIARMTGTGNILWSRSYLRPRGVVHDALVESNGSIVVVGMTDSTNVSMFATLPPSFQPKLFMMKLNGDGDVQWCKGWSNSLFRWYTNQPSRIRRTNDGQYAVLATLGMPENNLNYQPLLMKTDLTGDTLWTRSVGLLGYIYLTQDLLPYSDGGYLFSGIIYGDLPSNLSSTKYIFKTDSLGHFNCQEEQYPMQSVELFPIDSSFTLDYEQGLATSTPISVQDSILDSDLFTTWNACTFTTDLPPSLSRSAPKPIIRPNPNTGLFTVDFQDPLMADSYYSVYDVVGKLLYQRPLPAGKETEEVDLARYGAGTYVIRFTDPEGTCYERVVVE